MFTPILIYGPETFTTKTNRQERKLTAVEMRFLSENKSRQDRIINEIFRKYFKMKPIKEEIEDGQLRWYDHVEVF